MTKKILVELRNGFVQYKHVSWGKIGSWFVIRACPPSPPFPIAVITQHALLWFEGCRSNSSKLWRQQWKINSRTRLYLITFIWKDLSYSFIHSTQNEARLKVKFSFMSDNYNANFYSDKIQFYKSEKNSLQKQVSQEYVEQIVQTCEN